MLHMVLAFLWRGVGTSSEVANNTTFVLFILKQKFWGKLGL